MALQHRHLEMPSSSTQPLSFSRTGGPLVAVARLCGGAGASMLAHLMAATAAASSSAPILLVDTGGPFSSIGSIAGTMSDRSFGELARDVEAGRPPAASPFAIAADGLRVIAAAPQFERDACCEVAIESVLDDAQAAHGLSVVDCGSLTRVVDLVTLCRATHIVWVAPATDAASIRATAVLDALDLPLVGRELLAVRHHEDGRAAPLTTWTAIAQRRDCDLALIPHIAGIDEMPLADRVERAMLALQSLAGALC